MKIIQSKWKQFRTVHYVHCSICCYRHLRRITAITDSSKVLSFTLNYCFHLLWIIFIYTWLVLPPYNCSYFQVIYFQVTYIINITILLCFRLYASVSSLQQCVPFPLYGIYIINKVKWNVKKWIFKFSNFISI